jgi:serine/threonine protein kinase
MKFLFYYDRGYIAPEIMEGEKFISIIFLKFTNLFIRFTFASDIFSYGCILYEAITGNFLFYFVNFFFLGCHPFANPNGTINPIRMGLGKYNPIVTDEYDEELVKMCHSMLSVVWRKRGGGRWVKGKKKGKGMKRGRKIRKRREK